MFKGIYVALITPFKNDGSVDYTKFLELIDFQLENKTDGLVILGTTAETSNLTEEEYEEIIKLTVERVKNKDIKIIVGVGTNNYIKTLNNIKVSEKYNVDGLLIVSPYYIKPSQRALYNYFYQLANSTKLPIMLYEIPGRTGISISNEVILKLSELNNIVSLKYASKDLKSLKDLRESIKEDFTILSGDDDLFLEQLKIGANGIVSVVANVYPKKMKKLYEDYINNDLKDIDDLNYEIKEISNLVFMEGNPTSIKAYMYLKGMLVNKFVRLPLLENSLESDKKIIDYLRKKND